MPGTRSPNLPPPDISPELRARLRGLLPFGRDDTRLLNRGVGPNSLYTQRISYRQAEKLRSGVVTELHPFIYSEFVPPSDDKVGGYNLYRVGSRADNATRWVPIATRYSEGLQAAVEALADGSLEGRLVSGVLAITERLSHTWYDGSTCVCLEPGTLLERATAANGLMRAVALLESNVSPNQGGYNLDISLESWSAQFTTESAAGGLSIATKAVFNNPTVFGDQATTAGLVNAVADRLEHSRPVVDGQPVGPTFSRIET